MDVEREIEEALQRQNEEIARKAAESRANEPVRTERELVTMVVAAAHTLGATDHRTDPMERMEAMVAFSEAKRRMRPVLERAGASEERPMCFNDPDGAPRGVVLWLDGEGDVEARPYEGRN